MLSILNDQQSRPLHQLTDRNGFITIRIAALWLLAVNMPRVQEPPDPPTIPHDRLLGSETACPISRKTPRTIQIANIPGFPARQRYARPLSWPILGIFQIELTTAPSNTVKKKIKIYPPPQAPKCKEAVKDFTEAQLAILDPKGERKAMFNYKNKQGAKVGDILRVTFKNGEPFSGVCLSIRSRGIDTSFLLRNKLTRVSVEMSVKVFSPNVKSVEIVQRSQRKVRRARLTYMRYAHQICCPSSFYLATWALGLMLLLFQTTQARCRQRREYRHTIRQKQGEIGWLGLSAMWGVIHKRTSSLLFSLEGYLAEKFCTIIGNGIVYRLVLFKHRI